MGKTRKELRDELYRLRLQLELTKKEGNDKKIKVIKSKISDVRSQMAKAILEEKKGDKNGKSI